MLVLSPVQNIVSGSSAAIARPTFSRDFAGEKTLNNGTGPAITFTRASNATFFNASGTLQTASNDTPRFDHDPATGASRGLLIEEARTNSIRNSQAGGAVTGVSGTMPTNWASTTSGTHGITREVVATGIDGGLSYVDIKLSGTPTSNGEFGFVFEDIYQVVAANAQTWTASIYVKLQAGSLSNITIPRVSVFGLQNGVGSVAGQSANTVLNPTTSSLNTNRNSATFTFTSASVDRVRMSYGVSYTNGQQIGGSADGVTLRIAAPQLEQGAFATSYIPTTSAAATRATEVAEITSISSFYNQSEGTIFAEGSVQTSLGLPALVSIDNATSDERLQLRRGDSTSQASFNIADGGVTQVGILTGSWTTSSQVAKLAAAYKADDFAASFGGGAVATDTSGTLPTPTRLQIGRGVNSSVANGHIRKVAYWPRRLSNTLLQQLTT